MGFPEQRAVRKKCLEALSGEAKSYLIASGKVANGQKFIVFMHRNLSKFKKLNFSVEKPLLTYFIFNFLN
jgi:hypothetical protein